MSAATIEILVVTDPAAPRGIEPYLEALRSGGADWALLVRDHEATDDALARCLETLSSEGHDVPILVAAATLERVALCARLGTAGVHLAERGPSARAARAVLGSGIVSASVHDPAGLARRAAEGVELVTLAPFGEVAGKGRPLSDAEVRAVTELGTPVLALGAIASGGDVSRAISLGCRGVALRSWMARALDGSAALGEVRAWLRRARETRPPSPFSIS
jgi:thiamine monophosphate synthase